MAIMWLYMNMLLRLWRGSAAVPRGTGPARAASSSGPAATAAADRANNNNDGAAGSTGRPPPGRVGSSVRGRRGQENKKRVTRMVVIVIIAFAICWTPLQASWGWLWGRGESVFEHVKKGEEGFFSFHIVAYNHTSCARRTALPIWDHRCSYYVVCTRYIHDTYLSLSGLHRVCVGIRKAVETTPCF